MTVKTTEFAIKRFSTDISHCKSVDEALECSKLDWDVSKEKIYYQKYEGNGALMKSIPNYYVTIRGDNQKPLGIVGERYQPMQNSDAFDYLQLFVDNNLFNLKYAGSLRNGAFVYIVAQLHKSYQVKDETIIPYITFTTSHNGSSSHYVCPTSVRPYCWNVLNLVLATEQKEMKVRHTVSQQEKLEDVRNVLKLSENHHEKLLKYYIGLSNIKMNENDTLKLIEYLIPLPKSNGSEPSKASVTRAINLRQQIYDNFFYDERQKTEASQNTAFGLLNAFTQYVDHERQTVGVTDAIKDRNRFESALFGSGARKKLEYLSEFRKQFSL